MKLPKHFIDAIGADPTNCVLIVGAGLSKVGVRAGGGGLPDWNDLMQAMLEHLEESGRCNEAKLNQIQSWLEEDPPRYLEIAEEFTAAHGDDRDGYETFLRGLLMPDDLVESELHRLLLTINFRGIVSFNFDRVFEKQSDKLVPIVYPELTEQMGHFARRGFFAKIHGCITKPARQLVLTRSSYEELRNQAVYAELLKGVLLFNKVLCVGFSLRDPDFLGILADLKDVWRENFSPLYALMLDPGQDARAEWLKKGVAILPYQDHGEVKEFFTELAKFSQNGAEPIGKPVSGKAKSGTDVTAVLSEWQKAWKIEEMDRVLSDAFSYAADEDEKEHLLCQLAGLCQADQQIYLCPQLIAVGTSLCERLALRIILSSVSDDKDNLKALKPHPLHVPVHKWFFSLDEWPFEHESGDKSAETRVLTWLLDDDWGSLGIDVWDTFLRLLDRLASPGSRSGLKTLYSVSTDIIGAAAEIEKIVFASSFVHQDGAGMGIVEDIRLAHAEKALDDLLKDTSLSPSEMLSRVAALIESVPDAAYCKHRVVKRLIDGFFHASFLATDRASSRYNPKRARQLLDAIVSFPLHDLRQSHVLSTINCWEEHEESMAIFRHSDYLLKRLFIPYWWRCSTEARLEYLDHHTGGGGQISPRMYHSPKVGQYFLLEDLMGLHDNDDDAFRKMFNESLERYCHPKKAGEYNPYPLMELWRPRELQYELSNDCPPELTRRAAIYRADDSYFDDRWAEAKERAAELWQQRERRREYVSAERGDYVIDNLLGAYFPAQRRVVLYRKMVEYAAAELGVDEDALLTVVYMHETVHAFSHLGRDLNGNMWEDFAIPIGDSPDERPVEAHEAIAQFYTFKLLEWLDDKRLMDAFLVLEQRCDPVYRAWRRTEDYSLEDMRRILLRLRGSTETWPPTV